MKRIFRALAFIVLIGCCTLSGSSFDSGADFDHSVSFDGGALDGSQLSDKTGSNVFQHPFIVNPNGVPEENSAFYVTSDSALLQSDASDEPGSLGN